MKKILTKLENRCKEYDEVALNTVGKLLSVAIMEQLIEEIDIEIISKEKVREESIKRYGQSRLHIGGASDSSVNSLDLDQIYEELTNQFKNKLFTYSQPIPLLEELCIFPDPNLQKFNRIGFYGWLDILA